MVCFNNYNYYTTTAVICVKEEKTLYSYFNKFGVTASLLQKNLRKSAKSASSAFHNNTPLTPLKRETSFTRVEKIRVHQPNSRHPRSIKPHCKITTIFLATKLFYYKLFSWLVFLLSLIVQKKPMKKNLSAGWVTAWRAKVPSGPALLA